MYLVSQGHWHAPRTIHLRYDSVCHPRLNMEGVASDVKWWADAEDMEHHRYIDKHGSLREMSSGANSMEVSNQAIC